MTATSLVKTYAHGRGSTYPDLPWEPKQAFGAVRQLLHHPLAPRIRGQDWPERRRLTSA